MKVRVLGCSGGIGGHHLRTTSLLVDGDILIDCGTGVAGLSLAELAAIDHVFLTHSHLDHIVCLPLLIDVVADLRTRPLTVHCLPATARALREHVFNWAIWPDFLVIPSVAQPSMSFAVISVGTPVVLGERRIVPLPVSHTVPAVAYEIATAEASLVFSGDTGPCSEFWRAVNAIPRLRALLIEAAFSDEERERAEFSLHLCPSMLAEQLRQLENPTELFITHLKPGQVERTMTQIEDLIGALGPRVLQNNQVFDL